jgi:hypothetical protein
MGSEILDPHLRSRRHKPSLAGSVGCPLPYPDEARLFAAAQQDRLLACHQCVGALGRTASCPACLGTGYIRACGRCFIAGETATPCPICCGLCYTAGQPLEREDTFNRCANPRTSTIATA